MSQVFKTTEVAVMDFSKIFTEGEYFTGILQEVGLPQLFFTNKAIYKCVPGKGVIIDTGMKYNTYDQITKEFDFSYEHPIWQNTYRVIGARSEKELKILTYHIVCEFSSILHIGNYFFNQWENIIHLVNQNIKDYESSSAILPEIPMLKENLDGFFVECKNLVSHMLTIFKLYYLKKNILDKNPSETMCLTLIKESTFKSKNKDSLNNIFEKLEQVAKIMRAIRNSISHPENYKENLFLLYNVHWENNNVLCPPVIEYKTRNEAGQISVLDYVSKTYETLLEVCGSFLGILVQDICDV